MTGWILGIAGGFALIALVVFALRNRYAKVFAEVLVEFLENHYGFDLTAS